MYLKTIGHSIEGLDFYSGKLLYSGINPQGFRASHNRIVAVKYTPIDTDYWLIEICFSSSRQRETKNNFWVPPHDKESNLRPSVSALSLSLSLFHWATHLAFASVNPETQNYYDCFAGFDI